MTNSEHYRGRALAALAAGGAAVVALAACSSGSANPASSPSSGAQSAASAGAGSAGFAGARPAASGQIAAISGTSMQVQNPNTGQVRVSYTPSTKFTRTVTVSKSAITAGSCVTAFSLGTHGSTSAPVTALTATTIAVSAPVNGSCTRRSDTPGAARPSSGARTPGARGRPSGAPGTTGSGTAGQVSSVTATGIVVLQAARGSRPAAKVTVTIDPSTTITEVQPATAAELAVGKCVTAQGSTDSTGAVTATRVGISTAGANGCSSGFGRFGGNGQGGTGGA